MKNKKYETAAKSAFYSLVVIIVFLAIAIATKK